MVFLFSIRHLLRFCFLSTYFLTHILFPLPLTFHHLRWFLLSPPVLFCPILLPASHFFLVSEWGFISPIWCQGPGAAAHCGGRDWTFSHAITFRPSKLFTFLVKEGSVYWCTIKWQVNADVLSWQQLGNELNIWWAFLFLMLVRLIFHVFFCGQSSTVHTWRSEDGWWKLFLTLTMWVLGMKLKLSGLVSKCLYPLSRLHLLTFIYYSFMVWILVEYRCS